MSINTTAIVKEYGAYYIDGGQNKNRLMRQLLFGRETVKYARKIKTNDTVYRLAGSSMTGVVQGFQKAFTPKGELKFEPNPIQLYKLKVDFEIYPDDIEDNWLGFLADNNLSRKEWPLIRYIMESHLYEQIDNDMERNEYYKGVYKKPTEGTAGLDGESMNGLRLLLGASNINRLNIGPLDDATIHDQVEAAVESVSEEYQGVPILVCMSPKRAKAFLKDKRQLGFYNITGEDKIDNKVDFTKARVIGLPSMIGTDDLWLTPQNNFLHITKKGENAGKTKVEESKRCVDIMNDWYEGLGFGFNELVWTTVAEAGGGEPEPDPNTEG